MTFSEQQNATVDAIRGLDGLKPAIDDAATLILETLRAGGKLLIAGNGGSAAEASHFATELLGRYAKNRRPLAAIALSQDGSLLSCIGNDFGFEHAFSRQLAGLAGPTDLFIALSSSGNSANIIAALDWARSQNVKSIALLGQGGGKARGLATIDLTVPGSRAAAAQEAHLFVIHYFCELIDAEFC